MADKSSDQLKQFARWIDIHATVTSSAYRVTDFHRDLIAAFPQLTHAHPENFGAAVVAAMSSTLERPNPHIAHRKVLGVLAGHYRAHRPNNGPWSPESDLTNPIPTNLNGEPLYHAR